MYSPVIAGSIARPFVNTLLAEGKLIQYSVELWIEEHQRPAAVWQRSQQAKASPTCGWARTSLVPIRTPVHSYATSPPCLTAASEQPRGLVVLAIRSLDPRPQDGLEILLVLTNQIVKAINLIWIQQALIFESADHGQGLP